MKIAATRLPALIFASSAAAWPAASLAQTPPTTFHAEAAAPAVADVQPYLGVITERISDDLRHQFPHIQPGAGLIVRELMPHSPAAEANVTKLDILVRWNDQLLVHPGQLQVLVASAKPGDQVTLEFLHQGTMAKAQATLAARPAHLLPSQEQPQSPPPATAQAGLLSPELIQQAAAAMAKSGIDPAAIAGALQGVDLTQINLGALAPEVLRASKILILAPDGTQQEISLAETFKDGATIDQIMQKLQAAKIDPVTLLGSKIIVIKPDGSREEIVPADLLKNKDVNQLLQGLQSLQGLTTPVAP